MKTLIRQLYHCNAAAPLRFIWRRWQVFRCSPKRSLVRLTQYDFFRLMHYSGCVRQDRENDVARIVMAYHIIEKGLTMPERRMGFGRPVIKGLMAAIDDFMARYGMCPQVRHAIGVLHAYAKLHADFDRSEDPFFGDALDAFLAKHADVPIATQRHMMRADFFSRINAPFPEFAASRHTVRHYAGPVSLETIRKAVSLAMTAPSACNRQHARVYVASDETLRRQLLALQNGNRGFGHLADKLLVVTTDLADLCGPNERNDGFVNGGIFLMNLCYALHYYEVGHCILNWSVVPDTDKAIRALVPMRDSETTVALLTCGALPEKVDIAASPRRDLAEIYREL